MKALGFRLCALFAGCVAIAACSQAPEGSRFQYTPNVNGVPGGGSSPLGYTVLYPFVGPPNDGSRPQGPDAGLTDVKGTLYGTTYYGGTKCSNALGCGTVFSISTTTGGNKDKVLHNFGSYSGDGHHPNAGLIDVKGTLYGTTSYGGMYGFGTVFSINTSGDEHTLYSFKSRPDGENPFAGLINVKGALYGTTYYGGVYGTGTVFRITSTGTEKRLHSFHGIDYLKDGAFPWASLTNVSGTLYGTTNGGGLYNGGTAFSITTRGTVRVLHSFGKGFDGWEPEAGLISASTTNDTLYGTTRGGGTHSCGYGHCGTVFSITTTGGKVTETVLHNFSGGAVDGAHPEANLNTVSGILYGTTESGGPHHRSGTVFQIDLHTSSYRYSVLHNFGEGSDGRYPLSAMIYDAGNLIGVTSKGGVYRYGTVFSLPAFRGFRTERSR